MAEEERVSFIGVYNFDLRIKCFAVSKITNQIVGGGVNTFSTNAVQFVYFDLRVIVVNLRCYSIKTCHKLFITLQLIFNILDIPSRYRRRTTTFVLSLTNCVNLYFMPKIHFPREFAEVCRVQIFARCLLIALTFTLPHLGS